MKKFNNFSLEINVLIFQIKENSKKIKKIEKKKEKMNTKLRKFVDINKQSNVDNRIRNY